MKKKLGRRLLPLALCCALLAGSVLHVQATEVDTAGAETAEGQNTAAQETTRSPLDEVNDEIDRVDDELDKLEEGLSDAKENHSNLEQNKSDVESYLDQLNSQYESLSGQISQVQSDIKAKEAQIAESEKAIAAKEAEITEIEASIQTTKEQIDETQANLDEQYEAMKLRIQFMYENSSSVQFLELLLSSDSLVSLLNRAEYIEEMVRYDDQLLEEYKETKQALDEQEAKLEEDEARLTEERESLQQEQDALEQEKAELDDLNETLKDRQSSVAAQQSSSAEELQRYVDELVSSSDTINSYEEEIAAKQQYYEELLAEKQRQEEEEAKRQAEEEADNTGGNITEGDSGIDSGMDVSATDDEMLLLAAIIYCEAGGESYEGQLAVGYVIMNRVRSNQFPNTISGVVYQPNQFSPVKSGRLATILAMEADPDVQGKITDSCRRAAAEVINGTSNVGESLFFRTYKPVPQLLENLEANGIPYYIIGNHVFYHRWVAY